MSETAYLKPTSLEEAFSVLAENPEYVLLSGGTDFMVGVVHRPPPPGVIDLFGLDALNGVVRRQAEGEGEVVRIGAATTYAELLASPELSEFSLLRECVREIGATQIQERGTLGGNMGTSSPVGDSLPCLLALDAVVEVGSARGLRRVPYHEFCTGYRQTALAHDELIVAVELPCPAPPLQRWRKVGTRRAQAISKVMLAASARPDAKGKLREVRIAMGAVADRPVRLRTVEGLCEGQVPSETLAETVRDAVADAIHPISDLRSTAPYRLRAAQNMAARWILDLEAGS